MRDKQRQIGLDNGEFIKINGYVVCSTCHGNCGQCGVTGIVDNVPASIKAIANTINKQADKDKEEYNKSLIQHQVINIWKRLFKYFYS